MGDEVGWGWRRGVKLGGVGEGGRKGGVGWGWKRGGGESVYGGWDFGEGGI